MNQIFKKITLFFTTICALIFMTFTTGCASGGFKLTRQYAGWVNSQNIIIRIILYILTLPVYTVTLVIDAVIFNTLDFWDGRVSQGTYELKGEGKKHVVTHEFQPGSKLKKSTIKVKDLNNKPIEEIKFIETKLGKIEFYVNGKLKKVIDSLKVTAKDLPISSRIKARI